MKKLGYLVPILVVAVIGVLSALFVVDEREKVLVLRFGQIKQVVEEPGIGFKMPLLDEVVRFEDRILSLETEVIEVTPADDRRLEIDQLQPRTGRFTIKYRHRCKQSEGLCICSTRT